MRFVPSPRLPLSMVVVVLAMACGSNDDVPPNGTDAGGSSSGTGSSSSGAAGSVDAGADGGDDGGDDGPPTGPCDPMPALSVADAQVMEGNSGTAKLVFVITLSAPSACIVSVRYSTVDGTAMSGSDFGGRAGGVPIPKGETSTNIEVDVFGDVTSEPTETLKLELSVPVNATIADGEATGSITNDDG